MTRPPPLLRHGLVVAATLLLCACQPMGSDDRRAGRTPEFKRNPNPTQAYEITALIEHAPGPFEVVKGFAQYSAPNCTYMLDRVAGVPTIPEQTLPVDFAKADEGTYVGTVYLDAMLDDDYFGQGVCKWGLTISRIELRAGQSPADSIFVSWLDKAQIDSGSSVISHLQRRFYPRDATIDSMLVPPMVRDIHVSDHVFRIQLVPRRI